MIIFFITNTEFDAEKMTSMIQTIVTHMHFKSIKLWIRRHGTSNQPSNVVAQGGRLSTAIGGKILPHQFELIPHSFRS